MIVDPGPGVVPRDPDRPARRDRAARTAAHPHPSRPRRRRPACCAAAIPKLEVYVHERGAPHLVDPSKVMASASPPVRGRHGRALGRRAAGARGAVRALTRRRERRGLSGGIHAGPRLAPRLLPPRGVAATPTWATWPACGYRPIKHTVAPTPPPDIDVEAWLDSLHTIAAWNPQSLCLTHFGQVDGRGGAAAPGPLRAHRRGRLCPPRRRGALHRAARGQPGAATDPATVEALRAGRPARPALPGARALLAKKAEPA